VDIQLIAVMSSRFNEIDGLGNGVKIGTLTYGPTLHWIQTALNTYGISFTPVIVAESEMFEALKRGEIDAALIIHHPSVPLDEPFALGDVRFLPWSTEAVAAVTRAFPTLVRPAKLPPKTYINQSQAISGYAPS